MLWLPSHSAFMRKLPPPTPLKSPPWACSERMPLSRSSMCQPCASAAAMMFFRTSVTLSSRMAVVPCSRTNIARFAQKPVRTQWFARVQRKSYSFRFCIRPPSAAGTRGFIAHAHWNALA